MFKTKLFCIAGILAMTALVFIGCQDEPDNPPSGGTVKVTGVTLTVTGGVESGDTVEIWLNSSDPGEPGSAMLTANVLPSNATNKAVSWSVTPENQTYVEFNETTGAVSARAVSGKSTHVTITVTTVDGGETASKNIYVLSPGETGFEPVTSVNVTPATALSFHKPLGGAFTPANANLSATVSPPTADPDVTWTSSNSSVATVDDNGVVTPVGDGSAKISATSEGGDENGDKVKSNEIDVTVTVEGDPGPGAAELKIHNQAASPAAETTTTLEMNETTKRFTVRNADSGIFQAGGGEGVGGVTNATIVYLDKALATNSSISARVRITARGSTDMTSGVIVGLIGTPTGTDVPFMGMRATTAEPNEYRGYFSRTGTNNNSSQALSPVTSDTFDAEYILETVRTGDQAFTVNLKDNITGTVIATVSRAAGNNVYNIQNAYAGFIIANATVEISQITIVESGETIFTTPVSEPTPIVPISVEFIHPHSEDGEYTHSIAGGNNTLELEAKVLPAKAPQDITFAIDSTAANTAGAGFAEGNKLTFTGEGEVTVTATATGTAVAATLKITVTSGAVLVSGIDIIATSTSIMAGETLQFSATVEPGGASNKDVVWAVADDDTYVESQQATTVAGIDSDGLLTALTEGDVYIFAAATDGGGVVSDGVKITVTPYSRDKVYNFSAMPFWNISEASDALRDTGFNAALEAVVPGRPAGETGTVAGDSVEFGGLTFGSTLAHSSQNATATDGMTFTRRVYTGGAAGINSNAWRRWVQVPLEGPAKVTIYATSNNTTAVNMDITATVLDTTNLASLSLSTTGDAQFVPVIYNSTTETAHSIVLKADGNARIYMIKVEYID